MTYPQIEVKEVNDNPNYTEGTKQIFVRFEDGDNMVIMIDRRKNVDVNGEPVVYHGLVK